MDVLLECAEGVTAAFLIMLVLINQTNYYCTSNIVLSIYCYQDCMHSLGYFHITPYKVYFFVQDSEEKNMDNLILRVIINFPQIDINVDYD